MSSSPRFRGLPLGHFPTGWITNALLWRAVGAILLTCEHQLIFLVCCLLCWLHVCSPPHFFVSDLIHSGLSCSFSETPHIFCVNICLSLLESQYQGNLESSMLSKSCSIAEFTLARHSRYCEMCDRCISRISSDICQALDLKK